MFAGGLWVLCADALGVLMGLFFPGESGFGAGFGVVQLAR